MLRHLVVLAVLAALAACLFMPALAGDKPGCTDHPLFPTRMPSYAIANCVTKEFDRYEFFADKGKKLPQEGRFTFITYAVDERKNEQSGVAVVRNYEAAIKRAGGTIEALDPDRLVVGKIVAGGKEAWAQAEKGNGLIWLRIVEKQAMNQYIVADAASFANDLKASGHAAVYGIYFDTAKADLKPESTPALQEIAKLLAADPSLKLWVVGHTDWVGKLDDNMKLSQARAEAVVKALVGAHGVAAARVAGYGVGSLSPAATNATDEGRAKNRRVELVAAN